MGATQRPLGSSTKERVTQWKEKGGGRPKQCLMLMISKYVAVVEGRQMCPTLLCILTGMYVVYQGGHTQPTAYPHKKNVRMAWLSRARRALFGPMPPYVHMHSPVGCSQPACQLVGLLVCCLRLASSCAVLVIPSLVRPGKINKNKLERRKEGGRAYPTVECPHATPATQEPCNHPSPSLAWLSGSACSGGNTRIMYINCVIPFYFPTHTCPREFEGAHTRSHPPTPAPCPHAHIDSPRDG